MKRDIGFETFYRADILSKTRTATIDVGQINDLTAFREYLEYHGWEVTKEKPTIWSVSKTESC